MASTRPFHDPETGELDLERIVLEAGPIARLLAGFGLLGGLAIALSVAYAGTPFGAIFSFLGWLVVAVGGFVTLLYVILRALRLSGRSPRRVDAGADPIPDDGSGSGADGSDGIGKADGTDGGTDRDETR